jgi:hypothetical protein
MCTAAENACHKTKDPQACAVANQQEAMAGLGLAGGMGQLGASMQNNAASVAQAQRDVEAYKLANPTPPLPSPPLITDATAAAAVSWPQSKRPWSPL